MTIDLKHLFLIGNYEQVLRVHDASGEYSGVIDFENLKWIIGAYCFTGRKEEADLLYQSARAKANAGFRAACRFFLGVAFCRNGPYEQSISFFAENLKTHRHDTGETGFFAWQGHAFYNYYRANFDRAEASALKALSSANQTHFNYGRCLALDIYGHSLLQQGQVSAGLHWLSDAKRLAAAMGNGGLVDSIDISLLVYEAQFGLEPNTTIKKLNKANLRLDPQNSYAKANLLLELANQYLLRGSLEAASTTLQKASVLIYGSRHHRYANLLALRFAEISYRRGNFAEALHTVRLLHAQFDKRYDRPQFFMALELEIKLLTALGMSEATSPLAEELAGGLNRSMRASTKKTQAKEKEIGKSILNEDKIKEFTAMLKVAEPSQLFASTPYIGLIYEALNLVQGTSWLVVVKEHLLVLDKGEVKRYSVRIPRQLLKLLLALAEGYQQKENLIETIWDYTYRPLQHDPLIYQAIQRLRKVLGAHHGLIEVSENGYRLREGFGILSLSETSVQVNAAAESVPFHEVNAAEVRQHTTNLNERQLSILRLLKKKKFIGIQDCLKKFMVSDMSLKRDLSQLMNEGLVVRVGRARATRYTLKSHLTETLNLPPN